MIYSAAREFLTEPMATGDVLSFRIFGTVIVVLNLIKVNKDHLERHGDIFSDHPTILIVEMYIFSS